MNLDLINTFLQVICFSESFITLRSEITFVNNVTVYCGESSRVIQVCAYHERGIPNKTVHLKTTVDYENEYRPYSLYYYEVHTNVVIVFGSIRSSSCIPNS